MHGSRAEFPIDFERSDRHGRAVLTATVYTLVPPPGMEFDEDAVREIRSTYDRGFIPFHRKMVFRSVTGGDIVMHNWGICRFSLNGVQDDLLRVAHRPATGYFSTLEAPNIIDTIWPAGVGMDQFGLPPQYEPFDGPKVVSYCRLEWEQAAMEKYKEKARVREESKVKRRVDFFDDRVEHFMDILPTRGDWSTAVRPTPLKDQIKGDVNV